MIIATPKTIMIAGGNRRDFAGQIAGQIAWSRAGPRFTFPMIAYR
jgi:hypothetical protein